MTKIIIVGAGLSGLIAARMLIDRKPLVIEKQSKAPNNHDALLRFRTDVVSAATNIPFRKVSVTKAIHGGINPVSDSVRYSLKVTGKMQSRSISDLAPVDRYIAPSDLISRLSESAEVEYNVDFADRTNLLWKNDKPVFISTLPMPMMMDLFAWKEKPEFVMQPGWTARGKIKPEYCSTVNSTIYFPGIEPWYRVSVTGEHFIVEGSGEPNFDNLPATDTETRPHHPQLLTPFALKPEHFVNPNMVVKRNKYQKIGELNSTDREKAKRFIMWLSDTHSVYSLGRFATWRPKVLLDDIVNDVRVIARLIDGNSGYETVMK